MVRSSRLALSAYELVEEFRCGSMSIEDYMASLLERIESIDGRINAYITVNEHALEEARKMDRLVRAGSDGNSNSGHGGGDQALLGVPLAVKDNISTLGIRTTCASRMLADYVPVYDATVVKRLKGAGAIVIGKTNMDEFGMGSTTEFSAFGATRNPWKEDRVAGGSSGGSGAALAACMASIALGSDTGGSVRCPASFCSVYGLKPTYGLLSRYGLISYASSLDCIGLMARSVHDLALMLRAAGRDEHDHTSIDSTLDLRLERTDLKGLRFALIKEVMESEGMDAPVRDCMMDAVSSVEQLGATVEEVSMPVLRYALASYYTIAMAEASSNLARYDGVRYGHTMQPDGVAWNEFYSTIRSNFGSEVKRRIMLGTYVLSSGYYGRYYMKAQQARALIRDGMMMVLKDHDAVMTPTMPVLPPRIGERVSDPLRLYTIDICTVVANLAGIPALSIPYSMHDGLPIGIQFMAGHLGEPLLLRIAHALEFAREGKVRRCIL
ncbi:MAG: Asp-tRNA(Asn)/Glu-tRNA(Gln) amidotransferase subunit GatA [Candidatus Nitrosocaldus sp.]|nr:Asp-tRNA(Asn)/Glu-tRNA(Gln) amidotransferase subunit GatA [Candidatus Nitrosocaldus sp.]MDW7999682.1 Asp-tRNA(Asn)/Glu-tRNA(Gln) amidotransferase subunit GatA [Candidatus Nitrosocaldus sp.]